MLVQWKLNDNLSLRLKRDMSNPFDDVNIYLVLADGTQFPITSLELSQISMNLHDIWRRQRKGKSAGSFPTFKIQNNEIYAYFNTLPPFRFNDWRMCIRIQRYSSGFFRFLIQTVRIETEGNADFHQVLNAVDQSVICMLYHDYFDKHALKTLFLACFNNIVYHLVDQRKETKNIRSVIINNQLRARKRRGEIFSEQILDADFIRISQKSGKPLEFWIVASYVAKNIGKFRQLIESVLNFLDVDYSDEDFSLPKIKRYFKFEFKRNYLELFLFVNQFYISNQLLTNVKLSDTHA